MEKIKTILIVDDEASVLKLVGTILTAAGYRTLEAGGGQEALQVVKAEKVNLDLLITDIRMNKMTGLELAAQLREEVSNLRVLYISGFTGGSEVKNELEEGRTEFLSKPFGLPQLLEKVSFIFHQDTEALT